eukprot:scaffold13888_cov24-Tisochrysis_lutea.AAC.1
MAARVVDGECSIGGLFAGMVGHVQDRHHEAYLLQPSQAGGQVQLRVHTGQCIQGRLQLAGTFSSVCKEEGRLSAHARCKVLIA